MARSTRKRTELKQKRAKPAEDKKYKSTRNVTSFKRRRAKEAEDKKYEQRRASNAAEVENKDDEEQDDDEEIGPGAGRVVEKEHEDDMDEEDEGDDMDVEDEGDDMDEEDEGDDMDEEDEGDDEDEENDEAEEDDEAEENDEAKDVSPTVVGFVSKQGCSPSGKTNMSQNKMQVGESTGSSKNEKKTCLSVTGEMAAELSNYNYAGYFAFGLVRSIAYVENGYTVLMAQDGTALDDAVKNAKSLAMTRMQLFQQQQRDLKNHNDKLSSMSFCGPLGRDTIQRNYEVQLAANFESQCMVARMDFEKLKNSDVNQKHEVAVFKGNWECAMTEQEGGG